MPMKEGGPCKGPGEDEGTLCGLECLGLVHRVLHEPDHLILLATITQSTSRIWKDDLLDSIICCEGGTVHQAEGGYDWGRDAGQQHEDYAHEHTKSSGKRQHTGTRQACTDYADIWRRQAEPDRGGSARR